MHSDSEIPPLLPLTPSGPPPRHEPTILPPPISRPRPFGQTVVLLLLNLCLAMFIADAVVSLLDGSLIVLLGSHVLSGPGAVVFALAALFTITVYILMGFFPAIPKRVFLPITLLAPVYLLLVVP